MDSKEIIQMIAHPEKVWARSEILSKPNPIPMENGMYAWFFKEIPTNVPSVRCQKYKNMSLLYAGISPKNETSSQNLRKRILTHYRGNAEGSTLRLTLGVFLCEKSGFELRRVGSGKRKTFTNLGEQWLDKWMDDNAFVGWVKHKYSWKIEKDILKHFSLPLNIQDNDHHEFSKKLSAIRTKAKKLAEKLPIANEDNLQRTGGGKWRGYETSFNKKRRV